MEEIEFKDETIILFANTIRQIVQEEIQNAFKKQNVERFMDLSVVSVAPDASSATLKDLVTKEIFENIPNHTGIQLNIGDIVRMYIVNQTYNEKYIGETFGNRSKTLCNNYTDKQVQNIVKNIKK